MSLYSLNVYIISMKSFTIASMDGLYVFVVSLVFFTIYIFLEARPKGFNLKNLFKKDKN